MAATKTVCPIDRAAFKVHAKPVSITINGVPFHVQTKEFSTGSLGWFENGKVDVEVNGVKCKCQIGLNLTIVGSKELPPV